MLTLHNKSLFQQHYCSLEARALSEKPSGFPLTLSFSWHSNMAGAGYNNQMSTSQQHLIPYTGPTRNIKYMDEAEISPIHYNHNPNGCQSFQNQLPSNGISSSSLFRPKRSRSISANVRGSVHPQVAPSLSTHNLSNHQHSVTNGMVFRTPQSSMNFKSKRSLDAKFLALASSGLDSTAEPSPIANSDFLYRRLETIGSGSYATVYKTQSR